MNRLTFVFYVLFFLWTAPLLASETVQKLALLELAIDGDTKAQYELAAIYEEESMVDGDIFEPAPEPWGKALHWYEAAAEQGHKHAQYALLSRMYLSDVKDGKIKWLKLANTMAKSGDKYAQYRLARHFSATYVGNSEEAPLLEAIHWYSELLKGTEKQDDKDDILPRSITFTKKATIGDIKSQLKYFKSLAK